MILKTDVDEKTSQTLHSTTIASDDDDLIPVLTHMMGVLCHFVKGRWSQLFVAAW